MAFLIKPARPSARTVAHYLRWLVCLIAALLLTNSAMGEEEIDFGQSAAGQLKAHIEFDQPLPLPHSIFPGISGYATGEIGLHSTPLDEPSNDFFQLSTAADFRFILLAKDPGIEVWNDDGSAYMTNGESFYVGQPPFDTHPVWNITTGTPRNSYTLTLKLHDINGVYSDSAPFTIAFTPIAPAQLAIHDNGDDTITVTLQGTAGAEYIIEAAGNLVGPSNWTNVSTNIAANDGSASYTETKAGRAQRFYRCLNH